MDGGMCWTASVLLVLSVCSLLECHPGQTAALLAVFERQPASLVHLLLLKSQVPEKLLRIILLLVTEQCVRGRHFVPKLCRGGPVSCPGWLQLVIVLSSEMTHVHYPAWSASEFCERKALVWYSSTFQW